MAKRILIFLAWLHIMGGIALPFVSQLPFFSQWANNQLVNTAAANGSAFWIGVFGPTVASWGVLFLMQLKMYFANPTIMAWKALVAAVWVWLVLDTAYCLFMGVHWALVTNIPAGLLLLIPMWLERPISTL